MDFKPYRFHEYEVACVVKKLIRIFTFHPLDFLVCRELYANREDADQTALMRSLIRFVSCRTWYNTPFHTTSVTLITTVRLTYLLVK